MHHFIFRYMPLVYLRISKDFPEKWTGSRVFCKRNVQSEILFESNSFDTCMFRFSLDDVVKISWHSIVNGRLQNPHRTRLQRFMNEPVELTPVFYGWILKEDEVAEEHDPRTVEKVKTTGVGYGRYCAIGAGDNAPGKEIGIRLIGKAV